ncbi:MAG: hypothetical protein ACRDPH_15710 [Marmoricola sp.]
MSAPPQEFAEIVDSWSSGTETVENALTAWPGAALAALLDAPAPRLGDVLPPLWTEVYLRTPVRLEELGEDGHPRSSALVPRLPERRRVFGGGRIELWVPLRVGQKVRRESRVERVRAREGRSGWLLVVTEHHEFSTSGRTCVVEDRDIVYRRALDVRIRSEGGAVPSREAAVESPGEPALELQPDERSLFCFSALTYNPHRIHYDRDYTRRVEGHPDLLVHGPLLVLAGLEAIRRHSDRPVARVHYRLLAPAYPASPIRFAVEPEPGGALSRGVQATTTVAEVRVRWADGSSQQPTGKQ